MVFVISEKWASVQNGEVQDIKKAVGGLRACVKQFIEQQQDTARVSDLASMTGRVYFRREVEL